MSSAINKNNKGFVGQNGDPPDEEMRVEETKAHMGNKSELR